MNILNLVAEFIGLYKRRFVLFAIFVAIFGFILIFITLASLNQFVTILNKTKEARFIGIDKIQKKTIASQGMALLDIGPNDSMDILEIKARKIAINNAQLRAQQIASVLDVKLGEVIDYSEDGSEDYTVGIQKQFKITVKLIFEMIK